MLPTTFIVGYIALLAYIVAYFAMSEMDLLEKAMKGAWKELSEVDGVSDTSDNRKLLASCVVDEAIAGKVTYTELVNGAIARFREQQADSWEEE